MANTYVDYTGDGSETDFAINFDYIKTSHVAVEVNEGPAGGTNTWVRKTLGSDYTVVTSPTKQVVFTSAPANLVRVRVLRDSDANVGIVDFANGSVLTETELDNAYNHNRYLAQEAEEGASGGGFTKNPDGQYDADGLRIENLAAPDSNDDAANKSYVDTAVATEAAAKVSKTGDTMTGALTLPASDPTDADHATRKTYVDAQIATALATGVAGGPIDTVNIADDAVTAAKLDNTTVTPGSYTNTDITVDENGRITAASNGSSGAGATNLGVTHNAENVDVTSSTGDDITLNAAVASVGATPGTAGVMTDGDKEKLDGLVSNATHTGDVTGSTALTIANDSVTFVKMQNINTAKVIGRTTAGSGDPEEVSILDEDTMTSDSATALATQQSIKAYVDSQVGGWNFTNQTVSSTLSPPNTFTDLDLSSFVGANSAYVIFEASGNTGGYTLNLNFRKKGSTYDVASGIDKKITGSGIGYQLFGITDSSGVIQYRQSDVTGTGTITLKIIGYVK